MPVKRLGNPYQRFFVLDYETTGLANDSEPIEVGIIITDGDFALIETYESLILPKDGARLWSEDELGAFKVHGITPATMIATGRAGHIVATQIDFLADKHTVMGNKPVLVSDNAQFEWFWTKRLFEGRKWPFHYCAWDSSLFLEAAGIGDPKPAHRALRDAGLLHAAIVRALQVVKKCV